MSGDQEEQGIRVHTNGRLAHAISAGVSGNEFFFKGGSTGIVKLLEPLNPILNYFEYVILNSGGEGSIGIGVGERGYPTNRMPGWNRNSVGYHGDDGKLYHENGIGNAFGPTCTTGDRVGCGVDFENEDNSGYVDVFFTKNHKLVGHPVKIKKPVYGLYPLIGLHSRGERVNYCGHWHRLPDGLQEPMDTDHSPSTIWLRSNGVKFLDDGFTLEYTGCGGDVQDVGMAQSRYALTKTNHYFEMEILARGTHGALAIGLAKSNYPLHRHPGWNPGAVGYHADDGKLFVERGHGEVFGPVCTEGDRMGCGIKFSDESEENNEANEDSDLDSPEDLTNTSSSSYSSSESLEFDDESDDEQLFRHLMMQQQARGGGGLFGRGGAFGMGRAQRLRDRIRRRAFQGESRKSAEDRSGRKCTVYFTKNGETIGETECDIPVGGFYPVVAMLSKGEKLRVDLQPISG